MGIGEGGLTGDCMVSMGDCFVLRLVQSVPGVVPGIVAANVHFGFEAVACPARRRADVRGVILR